MTVAPSSLSSLGNTYSDLPLELRIKIANNLPGDSAMRLALSDKNLYNAINKDDNFWKLQFEKLAGFDYSLFKNHFSWKDLYVCVENPLSYKSKCVAAYCSAYKTSPEKIGKLFARVCGSHCWAAVISTSCSIIALVGEGSLLLLNGIANSYSKSPNQLYDKEDIDRSLTGYPIIETVFGVGFFSHIIAFSYIITKSHKMSFSNDFAPLKIGRKIGSIQFVKKLYGKIASWMVKK